MYFYYVTVEHSCDFAILSWFAQLNHALEMAM